MDIRQGDFLTLNPGTGSEADYPIRAVEDWTHAGASSNSFLRAAAVNCSIKRGVASGGKTASPTDHLTGLKCTPLMPVTAELAASAGLQSAHEVHQVFIADASGFVQLLVSETKRST